MSQTQPKAKAYELRKLTEGDLQKNVLKFK